MTERPLEHQANSTLLGNGSARDHAPCPAQLSNRGTQVLNRLLALLPSHLNSQPTSRISLFSPPLLFSICEVLQHGDRSASEQDDTSVLTSVLSKLRDWRLLDPNHRFSSGGIHKLALDLAGITDEVSASTSSNVNRTSHGRLRMRWVSSNSHNEGRDQGPSPPSSSTSPFRSGVLDFAQERTQPLSDPNQRCSDAAFESCEAGRLGTSDLEDASAVVSQRHHSVSGFRSGCSACRHIRVSGPSAPPSPSSQMAPPEQGMLFGDIRRFDTNINTGVASPRHPKLIVQRTTIKKTKRENPKSTRAPHIDENDPPLPRLPGIQQGIGLSFPRQRTHSPRIPNILPSRESFSPVTTSVQLCTEPNNLPNRTREGVKHTSSRSTPSVNHLLPIANHSHTLARPPTDLHPPTADRAHSFSFMSVNSHGLGSVANKLLNLPSNALGRSSKPASWSQNHRRVPTTTTSVMLNPTALSPKARPQNVHSSAPLRPRMSPSVPSDMKPPNRRSVSSQTHKHMQSAGSLLSSPLSAMRKWQV